MNLIDPVWLCILLATGLWTTIFSLSSRPGIRGWRNLGLLAGYVAGIWLFIALPWRPALATWLVPAVSAGLLYLGYDVLCYLRTVPRGQDKPRLGVLLHALFMWPIILPEAMEYLLAELGVLKPASETPGDI